MPLPWLSPVMTISEMYRRHERTTSPFIARAPSSSPRQEAYSVSWGLDAKEEGVPVSFSSQAKTSPFFGQATPLEERRSCDERVN
jgi:hypothetical protein